MSFLDKKLTESQEIYNVSLNVRLKGGYTSELHVLISTCHKFSEKGTCTSQKFKDMRFEFRNCFKMLSVSFAKKGCDLREDFISEYYMLLSAVKAIQIDINMPLKQVVDLMFFLPFSNASETGINVCCRILSEEYLILCL